MKLSLADYAGAAERAENGRALYRELGDRPREASAILLLARIAATRNDFAKADEMYRTALAIFEEGHAPAGIAAARASRADLFFVQSQYHNALSEGFAAIDVAEAATKGLPQGDARRNLLTTEANAMETVGNTYQKMVQLSRALDYYEQALSIRQGLRDFDRTASVWSNMATALIGIGKTAEAADVLEKALAVRRTIGNPANTAATLMQLGECYLAQGKPDEARKRYEEALSLPAGGASQAVALYQLGVISLDAGHLEQALSNHLRALEIRKKGGNPHDLVRSWIQVAIVHERQGELAEAESALAQALSGFETLSREVSDPVQLASFHETVGRLYPIYARVLFKEGNANEALLMAERGRGQALARIYRMGRAGFLDVLTPAERAKWDESAGSLAKAANRFRIAMEEHAPDSELTDARVTWLDAKVSLSRTRERIFADNQQLQSLDSARQPELQAILALSRRNPQTLYLQWLAVDNTSTLLFSLSSGEAKGYLLPAGSSELDRMVAEWRKTLLRSDERGFRVVPSRGGESKNEPELARGLYRAAFGPLATSLESGPWNRVVAVADGPLLDVPLAAMVGMRGKRLVERFAISSAVSFHSLANQAQPAVAASKLLVIGDPSEPGKNRVVIPSGASLAPLLQARAEAKAIAALFPGTVNLTGPDARESQVKSHLDCCAILHFATHGILDPDDGMDSGLLLAAEPADSSEDGVLQAWEIADRRLSAQLAVLSACDSARGDQRLGEGLVGLAWAFQAAGTPSVVASLWSVNDAATANLMRDFYSALKSGARSDDSLRRGHAKASRAKRHQRAVFLGRLLLDRPGRPDSKIICTNQRTRLCWPPSCACSRRAHSPFCPKATKRLTAGRQAGMRI